MLDERHDTPENFKQDRNDTNSYTWGRVGQHNVVIASLPAGEYGTTVAATTALSMRFSLPHIRIGLLVGIGAGIPRPDEYDIRLGDVVVSQPTDRSGGVVQYDFVKAKSGKLERTGYLNMPPEALRKGLAKLQAEHELEDSKITSYLDEMLVKHPKMDNSKSKKPAYVHQGIQNDRLFKSSYAHASGTSCQACDDKEQVDREPRDTLDPEIHYGVIASGNTLVKDAAERDSILGRLDEKCICFEMEAAGLMNSFPCLVIRGICDYADSHKNDQWQKYAAATAAGFAKELLGFIDSEDVDKSEQIGELLGHINTNFNNVSTTVQNLYEQVQSDRQMKESAVVLDWLSNANHQAQYADSLKRHQQGTGEWFLNSSEFINWFRGSNPSLFCPGIPGAGKTILASLAIQHLLATQKTSEVLVVFLYCNYGTRAEQTETNLLAALLKQVSQRATRLPDSVRDLHTACEKEHRRPTCNELRDAIISSAKHFKQTLVVVDAADESSDQTRRCLFESMAQLQKALPLGLMVTSRPISSIENYFKHTPQLEIRASKTDVEVYVRQRLQELGELVQDDSSMQRKIIEGIAYAVDGMFLLAQLYFDSLADKQTLREVKDALNRFNGLSNAANRLRMAYDGAVQRIDNQTENERAWARRVLSWVVHARRPLSTAELQHALAIRPGGREILKEHFTHPSRIVSLCAGLVTIQRKVDSVQLVHYTTYQYFQDDLPDWMSSAHLVMAQSCLTYLSFDAFSGAHITSLGEYKRRTNHHVLLEYAATFWGEHAQYCEVDLQQNFHDCLWNFLSDQNLTDSASQAMLVAIGCQYHTSACRWSGLHFLAHFGLSKLFLWIINKSLEEHPRGLDFDQKETFEGKTALRFAAEKGYEEIVKTLIRLGPEKVEADSQDWIQRTPLFGAAENGHLKIAKLLVELGPERVNACFQRYGDSPFSAAVCSGGPEMVKFFIDLGPERIDYSSEILMAVKSGHDSVVKELLEPKLDLPIDLNYADENGRTPLYHAAANGKYSIVELLINAREGSRIRKRRKSIVLYWDSDDELVPHEDPISKSQTLGCVNVEFPDNFGETPLDAAFKNHHDDVVDLLIKSGAIRYGVGRNYLSGEIGEASNAFYTRSPLSLS